MFEEFKRFGPNEHYFLIATFLMGLSNGMFDAVYNFYLEARRIDRTAIGYIYSVAMMMMACSIFPIIYLSKRVSQKKLIIISSFIYAIPFLFLPVLSSIWGSAIALGLILSGMISLLSLGNSLAGSNVSSEIRITLFSFFFISYLGAAMIGSVAVSLVTYKFQTSALLNYQGVLIASFFSSILMIYFRLKSIKNIIESKINIKKKYTKGKC